MALEPRKQRKKPVPKPMNEVAYADRPAKYVQVASRYQAFIAGELTVADLDDEEIMRGQLRGRDGSFKGRPPHYVPREFATALQTRQKQIIEAEISGKVLLAMETLDAVMAKAHPQPGDNARVNAAKVVLERYLGRVPETVNLKSEITVWQKHMEEVIVEYVIPEKKDKPKEIEE